MYVYFLCSVCIHHKVGEHNILNLSSLKTFQVNYNELIEVVVGIVALLFWIACYCKRNGIQHLYIQTGNKLK